MICDCGSPFAFCEGAAVFFIYYIYDICGIGAALVSMLTLESTMLTAFGNETMDAVTQKIMLGVTGGVISTVIITMAIRMIAHASRQLKGLEGRKQ